MRARKNLKCGNRCDYDKYVELLSLIPIRMDERANNSSNL